MSTAKVPTFNPDGSIAWQGYAYGELLDALRKDLLPDAAQGINTNSLVAAMEVAQIPYGKVVRITAGLQLVAGGATAAEVIWDTNVFTVGMGSGASGFTIQTPGIYHVSTQIMWNADTNGASPRGDVVISNITANGAISGGAGDALWLTPLLNGQFTSTSLSTNVAAKAGDRINVYVVNRDTVGHNVYGNGPGNPWTQMNIRWVSAR
jgi:hypothetical protein